MKFPNLKKRNYPDIREIVRKEQNERRPELTECNIQELLSCANVELKFNETSKEMISCLSDDIKNESIKHKATYEEIILSMLEDALMVDNFNSRSISVLMRKLEVIAFRNSYNPVKNYLLGNYMKYKDTKSNEFEKLCNILKVHKNDEDLKKELVKRWLVSAVASQFEKTFSSHGILTLVGDQGIGKTTFFRKLVPNELKEISRDGTGYFKEGLMLDVTNKDTLIEFTRNWFVELGEVGSTLKRNMDQLKAFITQTHDSIRLPYGRTARRTARRTIAGASIDRIEFLKDDENRRFWIVECNSIDETIEINTSLLWKEVYEMYLNGCKWFFDKQELLSINEHNIRYRQKNEVESFLLSAFDWSSKKRYELEVCNLYEIISQQNKTVTNSKIGMALKRMKVKYREEHSRKKYYEIPPLLCMWYMNNFEKRFNLVKINEPKIINISEKQYIKEEQEGKQLDYTDLPLPKELERND